MRKRALAILLFLLFMTLSVPALAAVQPAVRGSASPTISAPFFRLLNAERPNCLANRGPARPYNIIPGLDAAYLNQIALSAEGNRQCGVASAAMVLAMRGTVPPTFEAMAGTANHLWQSYANPTYVTRVVDMLADNGVAVRSACLSAEEAWQRLTAAVDCGAPSIVVSTRLTSSGSGHFLVAAGYSQQEGRRELIAYDPYGHWAGPDVGYHVNDGQPDSRRGEQVSYDFDAIWGYGSERCVGGYLLTIQP
jgi:hypothetical protein